MIADPSVAHLLGRVGVVEDRIRRLVEERRSSDPEPDDPFRGLYLSDQFVDRLLGSLPGVPDWSDASPRLAACEQDADVAEAAGHRLRLRHLASTFDLNPLDIDLLLVALTVDLDPRFEQLFGYLNDDVTRKRPSIATALSLCGSPLSSAGDRARLLNGPLVRGGLIEVEDSDRPLPGRALRVPDRVVGHLLGDDKPDPTLLGVLRERPDFVWGDSTRLSRALHTGIRVAYLREPPTGSAHALAVQALSDLAMDALVIDLGRLSTEAAPLDLAGKAVREARLMGCGLIAAPVGAVAKIPGVLEALRADPLPTLLIGDGIWDPAWLLAPPLLVDVGASSGRERLELWTEALEEDARSIDIAAATALFRLRPEQVRRAAASARIQSALKEDRCVTAADLGTGARAENGSALDRLARHIEPSVGWDDLVLPEAVLTSLREVALRARHRDRVLGEWGMRPGGGRGHGVIALFAGDSGTGKTMSAEVVAHDLGLDLYVVDLATVVDKYIGETEKNLERIFTAASGVNGVLLFDEADAVFGKRSEVKDAHDRYANIESAYLLQRMESFDGLAILATNLRSNLDDAFTRRLDSVVDFPIPDSDCRSILWDRCIGTLVPRSTDLNLGFLGESFELAGGAIRAACVTAAYLAAEDGEPIDMSHLIAAVRGEYRKLGRLTLEAEFGEYWHLVGPRG